MLGTPESIIAFMQSGGYIIVFFLMFMEGPFVTVLASFASSFGIFNIYYIFILSVLGNFIPDTMYFFIGKFSKRNFVERLTRKFGLSEKREEKLKRNLHNHTGKTIAILKLAPLLPVAGVILCGYLGIPYKKFALISLITNVFYSLIFVALGFSAGAALNVILKYLQISEYLIPIIFALILIIYIIFNWLAKKYSKNLSF